MNKIILIYDVSLRMIYKIIVIHCCHNFHHNNDTVCFITLGYNKHYHNYYCFCDYYFILHHESFILLVLKLLLDILLLLLLLLYFGINECDCHNNSYQH